MPSFVTPPELTRPLALARLSGQSLQVDIRGEPDELDRVARRLRVLAIARLEVRFSLRRLPAGVIQADGELAARVTQECVVSLDPVEQGVEEIFTVCFVPGSDRSDDDLLDPDSIDEIPYDGDRIDLGEAAVEQLALALDPFPRKPGLAVADASDPMDPDDGETAKVHPFASVRARRDED